MDYTPDYIKHAEKPFPFRINWVVVAGNRELDILEATDIVYDLYDLKIRKMELIGSEAEFIPQTYKKPLKSRKTGRKTCQTVNRGIPPI